MPLLFWYPIIVWSSMCSLALDNVTPRKPQSRHRDRLQRSGTDPEQAAALTSHYM